MYSALAKGRYTFPFPEHRPPLTQPVPPHQFFIPELRTLVPITIKVAPVTTGGKTRWMILAGMKEIRHGVKAQSAVVPSILP